jgi:branched-chain amino acid transport system ATP-binding protein
MLATRGLKVYHGPIEAVHGVDIEVAAGQCVALLGPNGAGKTSTLSAIMGTARATGAITFSDKDIGRLSVEERFRLGIALSPEGRRIFSNISVRDNLWMGAALIRDKRRAQAEIERWFERFPILGERRNQRAGTLSGGEQQMLAIARALLAEPKILLLDEPSLGLAPRIIGQIFEIIADLRKAGMTILLVEQNASAAMDVADYVYVLNNGVILSQGHADRYGDGTALMNELTGVQS